MASRRTLHGVQSAEEIIEAVDVWRQRREERRETGKEVHGLEKAMPLESVVVSARDACIDASAW